MMQDWLKPVGNRPTIVAHRGASSTAPENTLAAFRRAIEIGAPVLELDVHRTADGEIVVMHDGAVDRTTNGTGAIASMTLEQLRVLDAGSWKGEAFAGEPVPTLAEVCRLARGHACLFVEMKAEGIADQVISILEAEAMLGSSLLMSFSFENMRRVKEIRPDAASGFLTGKPEDLARVNEIDLDALCIYYQPVTEELARSCHAQDRLLSVWTVDDPAEVRRMAALGSDFITSNDPEMALAAVGGK